ncbi:galactose-3-O-sulfotransferase 2-like isoform X2 [Acropora millepora]|uniref:galactose-3-O-sulfotransferase 2-like isoform X2 n=1 Tax=Acropora millepora TaxID=45264 RepID=UPI0010FC77F2|nr:galactose-3-O-sulfotransferase 2-like isoform X2 [Acropora millepora]
MRNKNVLFPAWVINIGAVTTCLLILLYFRSQAKVMQRKRDIEEREDKQIVDVKYIEFFSVRPLQLVYLDKKGYRLALDSTDESSFIEAKHGVMDSLPVDKSRETSSHSNSADTSITKSGNDSPMNAYEESDVKGDTERDESIDYNMEWEEFSEPKRIPCTSKYPAQHVVLLRTHRSGSSTIANIMYRYGDLNDLEFALPKQKSYDFYWPLNFNPSFVDKKYLNLTPPDLLINARYSPDTMTSFMSKDSYFVTIIRKPSSHFESVFNGYQIDTLLGMYNVSDPLDEFLSKPRHYLLQYLKEKPRFDMNLNMAKNGQIFDLGLQHKYYNDPATIRKHINDLAEKAKINDWNNADAALYEFFNNSLWNKITKQDKTFFEEVEELRRKVRNLEKDCIYSYETNHNTGEVEIKFLAQVDNFNKYLCEKMIMTEEKYVEYLKKKVDIVTHNYYQNRLFSKKIKLNATKIYNISSGTT